MFVLLLRRSVSSQTDVAFNRARVIELVADFYRANDAKVGTRFVVADNLERALYRASLDGLHDDRLSAIGIRELPGHRGIHEIIFDHVLEHMPGGPSAWFGRVAVVSAGSASSLSSQLGDASRHGLGWLIAARGAAIIVPMPVVRLAEGRSDVLHDDTGRKAIIWSDGHGYYFLHGSEFDKRLYYQIIDHQLLIQDIAALDNADHRAIALQYLTFEQLVVDSDAELIDRGVRGTALYRLPLPSRLARDRVAGYGDYDYFIHMRDASNPERQFIEWVDPWIGQQRDAELCQAYAFGISLAEWLSIQEEG
ncbi:hypothetical protein [Mycobacterium sp. 155]|uniref:hypothetical protein n=1 Tax=Mycobacterium sp. 155 TaxID=1157943 RepID=UPI0003797B85|nr:hypothetical protein [Mycobacterium sp. 155]